MGHMSDAELRAAFRQAVERAEQSPGEHCLCRMTQRMQHRMPLTQPPKPVSGALPAHVLKDLQFQ